MIGVPPTAVELKVEPVPVPALSRTKTLRVSAPARTEPVTTPFFAEVGAIVPPETAMVGVETTVVLMVSAAEAAASFRAMVSVLVPTRPEAVSYTHLRAHETRGNLVCRLLLEKKK